MASKNKLKKITTFAGALGVSAYLALSSASAASVADAFGNSSLGSSLDLNDIAATIFRILLAVAILWVIFNIVMAGIKIAGAKEDADKRKEGLKSIVNAAIGLVVALSAFLIANTVAKQVTGTDATDKINELKIPCIVGENDSTNTADHGKSGTVNPDTKKCEKNP